jgi:hypothetical protein
MGSHVDTRSRKKKDKVFDEGARKRRASFKQYLRDLEEELLEEELDDLKDDDDELNVK